MIYSRLAHLVRLEAQPLFNRTTSVVIQTVVSVGKERQSTFTSQECSSSRYSIDWLVRNLTEKHSRLDLRPVRTITATTRRDILICMQVVGRCSDGTQLAAKTTSRINRPAVCKLGAGRFVSLEINSRQQGDGTCCFGASHQRHSSRVAVKQ